MKGTLRGGQGTAQEKVPKTPRAAEQESAPRRAVTGRQDAAKKP